MADLQAIFEAIKELRHEEVEELRAFVTERDEQLRRIRRAAGSPQERITALRAAREQLREGISDDEMREIASVMNAEYIDPKAWALYADDDEEDES